MTFLEIRQLALRRLQFADSPATAVTNRVNSYINRWHRRLLANPGMKKLRRVEILKASVADQATYGISLAQILHIHERTNDRRLQQRSLDWYRHHVPDPTAVTGTPMYWIHLGWTRVHTLPANASELFVISSSASDIGTAFVEVVRSDGHRRSLSATMNGTTAVSLGAAITDVEDVLDFFISAAAVGTVRLREDSGSGTELAVIPIGAQHARYLRYGLAPTPSSAITYRFDGIAEINDMTNDNDEPLLPVDYHDLLADCAVYDEWLPKGRAGEYNWLRGEIDGRIKELRAWVYDQPDGYEEAPTRSPEDELKLPIV